jgi:VanZ family protein
LKRYKTTAAVIASAICFVLLFVGGPEPGAPRTFMDAWNLGHILAFALWTTLLIRFWPACGQWPWYRRWLWVLGLAAALGSAVEVAQSFIGRMAEIGDVVRDLTGCALALALWAPSRRQMPPKILRCLQTMALVLLLVQVLPFLRALTDEAVAMEQFPALGTFESPFELDRWKGSAKLSIDRQIKAQGHASLKIEMDTKQYSGCALDYFPHDWRGYSFLRFSVFNPSAEPLEMTCRVNDRQHDRDGYGFDDRFNRRILIEAGWNRFLIPIVQIEDAPRGRQMDLTHIAGFGIFATRLPSPRTVYLDDLRLTNQQE